MKVFITGGTGLQGTFVVQQLVEAGHTVVALARSDASVAKAKELGASPVRGDHRSLDVLRDQASSCDAVLHLAFRSFSRPEEYVDACAEDREAITTMCDAMVDTGKTFIYAGGTFGTAGETEDDPKAPNAAMPRGLSEELTLSYAKRGMRALAVRCAPVVHDSAHRHLFITAQIEAAKKHGYVGVVGEGTAVWPAVHAKDAAAIYVLGLDPAKAPNGARLHAVAEEGVPVKAIAELIARKLGQEVRTVDPANALQHFGFTGFVLQMSNKTTAKKTKEWLGWEPKEIGLLEELEGYDY